MRGRVLALPSVPERPRLKANDLLAALAVFLLVVASTFPVVLPFVFIQDVATAKTLSRGIALVMLFLGGLALGRYAGYGSWKVGLPDGRGSVHRWSCRGDGARRMRGMRRALFVVLTAAAATTACAAEEAASGRRASSPERPAWEFGLTAYPTYVRDGENYTSAIAVADRGALHLEARYDYESIGARSAFVGWTLAGGERLHLGSHAAARWRLGNHAWIRTGSGSEPGLEPVRFLSGG